MRQIVDAVAAIHAAGVVHRDLEPENIVVDRSGRAVIVDFGLARLPESVETTSHDGAALPASGSVTKHGAVLDTPRYMAPEQAAGEVADARSDVDALGLVLEEIAVEVKAALAAHAPGRTRARWPYVAGGGGRPRARRCRGADLERRGSAAHVRRSEGQLAPRQDRLVS
jgi:serine/threonine protein kinase